MSSQGQCDVAFYLEPGSYLVTNEEARRARSPIQRERERERSGLFFVAAAVRRLCSDRAREREREMGLHRVTRGMASGAADERTSVSIHGISGKT